MVSIGVQVAGRKLGWLGGFLGSAALPVFAMKPLDMSCWVL